MTDSLFQPARRHPWPLLPLLLVLLRAAVVHAEQRQDCLSCHGQEVHAQTYQASVHQDLACTACHRPDLKAQAAPGCATGFREMDCARCHQKEADSHAKSVHHGKRLPVACWECHAEIHELKPLGEDRAARSRLCAGCHEHQEAYFSSIHFRELEKGNKDAPGCPDCHGVHDVKAVDNDAGGRVFHTKACLTCHADSALAARNELPAIAAKTFFSSFHGKAVRLGYPERVAGCADCHTAHAVLPADDPASTVSPERKLETCSQCHEGTGEPFTRYLTHADDRDRHANPLLFWARVLMTTLLVGSFFFFWAHTILWAFRSFAERRANAAKPRHEGPAAGRTFRRFSTSQIVLHLVMALSFFTLALSGLPLRFSDTGWGKAIMDLLGGSDRARTIHLAAAVVTFAYFAVALWMSGRFLLRRDGKGGFLARLTGPDSLFPTRRDWRDFTGMVRWFLFKGPKPDFDRWTYWEKFDVLADFWGMFAIGGSGLLLWFSEFFGRFLPGWWFNVATIIHSYEALLATGFIFTIHFFNTHFRPEKFPLDTVIFNGRISEEEMREERADQLARLEAEGRLHELECGSSTPLAWEIAYRVFAIAAVGIGLALALLMGWALLSGRL